MRWTPTGDNHHNAWLCPHCNQGNESPQSLTKRAEAAEAELAALKVRLENNERSACGMAEQANIERRRAESAEAELSRVKGERDELKAKISRNREAEFDAAEFD